MKLLEVGFEDVVRQMSEVRVSISLVITAHPRIERFSTTKINTNTIF